MHLLKEKIEHSGSIPAFHYGKLGRVLATTLNFVTKMPVKNPKC